MTVKTKAEKKSPEVGPTPSTAPSSVAVGFTTAELRIEAVSLVNQGRKYKVEMSARHWTLAMTEEVDTDLAAFNKAREAWQAERDLRKAATQEFRAEVKTDTAFRENLVASMRFIGQTDAALLADTRLRVTKARAPKKLSGWLNEAIPLVQQYERELIACGFAADPVAMVRERATALINAIAAQDENQKFLPDLAKDMHAARATLVNSMERLRSAGMMTFAGNKDIAKRFRKSVEQKRKAKATKGAPVDPAPATPAPAADNVTKPAASHASDASKAAS